MSVSRLRGSSIFSRVPWIISERRPEAAIAFRLRSRARLATCFVGGRDPIRKRVGPRSRADRSARADARPSGGRSARSGLQIRFDVAQASPVVRVVGQYPRFLFLEIAVYDDEAGAALEDVPRLSDDRVPARRDAWVREGVAVAAEEHGKLVVLLVRVEGVRGDVRPRILEDRLAATRGDDRLRSWRASPRARRGCPAA